MPPANEIIYYDFDEFRIDVNEQRLSKNGNPLALTQKAFAVLIVLVENSGQIVEKEKIVCAAWGDGTFVEEVNLSQYVYVLRKTLGNNPHGNSYIETVTKRGFRFTAPVKAVLSRDEPAETSNKILSSSDAPLTDEREAKNSEAQAESSVETISALQKFETENSTAVIPENPPKKNSPAPPQPVSKKPHSAQFGFRFLLIAVLLSGMFFAVVIVYQKRWIAVQKIEGAKVRSIAVLPFKTIGGNGSANRNDEKPGLGMADAIITRLNKSKKFQVRSTSAVSNLTDQPAVNARRVGSELAVDAVLEGTVQRAGASDGIDKGRMRVTAQLTNVADGKPLWTENYDEPVADIFTVQDAVSEKIALSLESSF